MGYGKLPVCIAKTQYSFTTSADSKGAPTGFTIPVREVRLSAGAEFIVAICGEVMNHAGPAARAGRRLHRRRAGRQDRRAVLIRRTIARNEKNGRANRPFYFARPACHRAAT
jgi:hypothetical protein